MLLQQQLCLLPDLMYQCSFTTRLGNGPWTLTTLTNGPHGDAYTVGEDRYTDLVVMDVAMYPL